MQEIQVGSLGQEDPLEKETATHSSTLAWRSPMDRGAWRATVRGVIHTAWWPSTGEKNSWEDHKGSECNGVVFGLHVTEVGEAECFPHVLDI